MDPEKIKAALAAGYSRQEIDAYLASRGQVPDGGRPETVIPEALAPAAFVTKLREEVGQMAARAGNLLSPGQPFDVPPETPVVEGRFPVASALGEAAPYMIPTPGGFLPQVAAGAALGALSDAGPARGAAFGAGGAAAGFGLGQMAGRVAGAIRGAARGAGARVRLASGVRQTLGGALDSAPVRQIEAGLARNPLTARPFAAMEKANQKIFGQAVNRMLGVADDLPLEQALTEAYEQSTGAIARAVPDEALIPLTGKGLTQKFKLLGEAGEALELPLGERAISGAAFKNLRSDLTGALRSAKAGVRSRAREAIDLLDEAAGAVPEVDEALYAAGRRQYRAWKTVVAGSGVDKTLERVNPATFLNNARRSYGEGTVLAGRSSGQPAVDAAIGTARDMVRAGSSIPNSGTPTGLWMLPVLADVGTTGGAGTLAAVAGSELMQSGAGAGAAYGAMQNPATTSALAAALARAGATEAAAP